MGDELFNLTLILGLIGFAVVAYFFWRTTKEYQDKDETPKKPGFWQKLLAPTPKKPVAPKTEVVKAEAKPEAVKAPVKTEQPVVPKTESKQMGIDLNFFKRKPKKDAKPVLKPVLKLQEVKPKKRFDIAPVCYFAGGIYFGVGVMMFVVAYCPIPQVTLILIPIGIGLLCLAGTMLIGAAIAKRGYDESRITGDGYEARGNPALPDSKRGRFIRVGKAPTQHKDMDSGKAGQSNVKPEGVLINEQTQG